jgi:hypothetical protein
MKKLLAVLLALCVAGFAFAQVTTALTGSGTVTLVNEDTQGVFAPDGSGYDTFTFSAADKDGKFGFAMTDGDWTTDGLFTIRNWNAWYKGQFTKVILGNNRNADFRGTLIDGMYANYIFGMDRITGQGVLIESTTLGALTLGVNLPVPLTATDTVDILKKADIGVKYAIDKVGTVYGLVNLNPAFSNYYEFAFKYTGVENLSAVVLYKGDIGNAATHYFAAGANYAMDKLTVAVEFDGQYATAFDGEIAADVSYLLTDALTASVRGMYDFGGTYDAYAKIAYDYGNNLGSFAKIGYDGGLYYSLAVTYSISF